MSIDRRLIAGALGLALALSACGGSGTGASSAPATAAPTQAATAAAPTEAPASAEPTDQPTDEPTDQPASSGYEPSLAPGAASDLENMLPDEAGGVKFQKTSFDGASLGLAGAGIDTAELGPILKANGKTISDVRFAIAAPASGTGTETAMVFAFQIRGVDATKFMDAMGTKAADLTSATIGGKQVLTAGAGGFGVIAYPKGDVLFEILLASDTLSKAILAKLP
jgi:hypothetical protein